jgi:hypothetical protein
MAVAEVWKRVVATISNAKAESKGRQRSKRWLEIRSTRLPQIKLPAMLNKAIVMGAAKTSQSATPAVRAMAVA